MKQWLIAAVSIFLTTVLPAQNISSTFNTNAEGWTVINDPVGTVSLPTYNPTGGSPGGCISKFEGALSFPGLTLFFVAPSKYLGSKSWAFGNSLSFDIRSERTATTTFSADNIVLQGSGITLFFNIPTPSTAWTHIDCPLVQGFWVIGNRNGRVATNAEIQTVLCNITRLWIRCEYITGADEGFLDNVVLGVSTPCLKINNQNLTICSGQSVRFNNKTYSTTGVYTDTLKNTNFCALNCDSVINLNLRVLNPIATTVDTTICQGDFIRVGTNTYNQTGTYTHIFRAVSNCDSTVTTRLTVITPIRLPQNFTICQGSFITVGSKTYNRTGVFIDTFKNRKGCDSLILTTNLLVNPISLKSQSFTICQGSFIRVGSKTYNRTGVFIDTLKNFTNCDSIITTSLIVNPISLKSQSFIVCQGDFIRVGSKTYNRTGVFIDTLKNFTNCDSIITTTLIFNPISLKSQSFTICQGDFIRVGSKTYNRTGVFIDTLKNFTNCDSIITTTLIFNPISLKSQSFTICQGDFIRVGSKTYNRTGVFIDTLKNFTNCDSIITTTLIVNPISLKSQSFTICQGDFIRVGSKTYNRTGVFIDTLKNFTNCDSIITTTLLVNPISLKSQSFTICQGSFIRVGSKTYNRTGVFIDTLKNFTNCDSIITTTLIVNPISLKSQNFTICQGNSVKVGSKTYNKTGIFTDTLKNFTNCDSIITTNLTVLPPLSISQNLSICEGDFVKISTNSYNQTGVFKDTLRTAAGCDSIVTTNLTVNPRYARTQNISICPSGSFAIGNKTYTQAGTYRDTFRTIQRCDSIITTVLTIQNTAIRTQIVSLCNGQSLKIGTKTYTQTGIFRDTFRAISGCDSIVITDLTVNKSSFKTQNLTICQGEMIKVGTKIYAQNGTFTDTLKNFTNCDSIITTNLTMIPPLSISQNLSICQGDFIKIGIKTYNQTGIFKDTLKAASGCDSIVTTNLTVNPTYSKSQNLAICEGGSVKVGSKTYMQTGIFIDTLKTIRGCDSVITTSLTVNLISRKTQSFTICKDNFIKVGTKNYTQSGVFTDILKTIAGCDSIITTNLTVIPPLSISQNLMVCEGDFIKIGIKTHNKTGIFKDTLRAVSGCDSIVTTNLTVNPRYNRTQNVSICPTGSYTINFKTYTQAGTYRDTLFSTQHCDSIVTTVLSIQSTVTFTQDISFCNGNSLKIGSKIYTRTGTYRDTLRAFFGCDSIVVTNLTVNFPSVETLNATICQGEFFKVGTKIYTQSGTYTDILKNFNNCDSVITTKLTVIPPLSKSQNLTICQGDFIKIGLKTYNRTGVFKDTLKAISGCDSIVTTNLTVNATYSKSQNLAICEGSSVKVGNKAYIKTGIFTDTLKTITGCDSIITTNLAVYSVFVSSQSLVLCEGSFIKVGNKTYTKSGIFTDTLTSKTGCDSIVLTILRVNPLISRTQTVTICPTTSLKIGTHTYTKTGTYRDTLRNFLGCDSIVTTVLNVQLVVASTQTVTLCKGESLRIGARTYTQTGIYRDTLRTLTGCDSLVTTDLTINTVILKSQNITICEGEFVKSGTRIYLQSGIFKDTLRALAGCDSIVTTNLTVMPLPIQRIDTTLCGNKNLVINGKTYSQTGFFKESISRIGKCDSVVQISLTIQPLSLKRNDITLCPNDTIIINGRVLKQAGLYRDTIASATGCPHIVESNVQNSRLRVNAGADITIEIGDSTRLSPAIPTGTNVLWHWKANKALSCVNCPNPIAKPLESTTFSVEATDTASDCTVRDDIRVVVKSCTSLFLPTSFSPNDDGHNDYFTIFAAGCVLSVKKMMVFNRWGALIFSKDNFLPNNEQDGWDGTFQGKPLPSDVYTYLIELELGNGKTEKVWGDVTLMK